MLTLENCKYISMPLQSHTRSSRKYSEPMALETKECMSASSSKPFPFTQESHTPTKVRLLRDAKVQALWQTTCTPANGVLSRMRYTTSTTKGTPFGQSASPNVRKNDCWDRLSVWNLQHHYINHYWEWKSNITVFMNSKTSPWSLALKWWWFWKTHWVCS